MKYVTLDCAKCGTVFKRRLAHYTQNLKAGQKVFCSKSCLRSYSSTNTRIEILAQPGYAELLQSIWSEHYFTLRTYAYKVVHDWDWAEDVVANTMASLLIHPTTYEDRKMLKNKLYLAVRNRALDEIKPIANKPSSHLDLRDYADPNDTDLITSAVIDQLYKEADHLPPSRRRAVILILQGFSYEEIASRLSLSEQCIRNHKQSFIKHLKKVFTPQYLEAITP